MCFPSTDGAVDYDAPQSFRRAGDWLVADLKLKSAPTQFAGVLASSGGRGLEFHAVPGAIPATRTTVGTLGRYALLWAVLGAIAGGILLNLMPCVFPILALKALHLSRAGGEAREARKDAIAYTAGAIVGTGALGGVLLAIRAAGTQAGWAFQLQDPRTIMLLLLLAVAITANLSGCLSCRCSAAPRSRRGASARAHWQLSSLHRAPGLFWEQHLVRRFCCRWGSIAVFAALGFGLALPFVIVAFVPALRSRLPRPGAWMKRLQRFLAIPMGLTALAAGWLLYPLGGERALLFGIFASAAARIVPLFRRTNSARGGPARALCGLTCRASRGRRRHARAGLPGRDHRFAGKCRDLERRASRRRRSAG